MKRLLIAILILVAMSGIAIAEIEEDWAFGKANAVTENISIECAYWDFEEGSNCMLPFNNQHPDVATFLDVPATRYSPLGYGPDYPSYARVGGSMCGTTRCYMNIYPYDNRQDWIYIVNGRAAFSPVTCCESSDCWTGECYPGRNAKIEFKEGTTYISFLVSTGNKVYVRLYDRRGNWLGSETVCRTIDRTGDNPSNFTRVGIYLPDKEIDFMTISGTFNDWHADDLIVGGAPGYLNKPVDYTDVARLAEELYGMRYHEHCLGFDYEDFTYAEVFQFDYPYELEYWDPVTKTFKYGEGISDEGLVLWAYNKITKELYGKGVVKHSTEEKMMKHDFTVPVESADTVPADVYFMDHDFDEKPDWVGMVVEETPTGMNLIGSYDGISEGENVGVIYSKKSIVESSPAFMGYYRLPGVVKGGHNPIPKGH